MCRLRSLPSETQIRASHLFGINQSVIYFVKYITISLGNNNAHYYISLDVALVFSHLPGRREHEQNGLPAPAAPEHIPHWADSYRVRGREAQRGEVVCLRSHSRHRGRGWTTYGPVSRLWSQLSFHLLGCLSTLLSGWRGKRHTIIRKFKKIFLFYIWVPYSWTFSYFSPFKIKSACFRAYLLGKIYIDMHISDSMLLMTGLSRALLKHTFLIVTYRRVSRHKVASSSGPDTCEVGRCFS